jgi:hypothetical protein
LQKINKKTKNNQSLVRLVKNLKELQNFKLNYPKGSDISSILDNPEEFAEQFAQNAIETEGYRILEAKKLGTEFAESLMEEKDVV